MNIPKLSLKESVGRLAAGFKRLVPSVKSLSYKLYDDAIERPLLYINYALLVTALCLSVLVVVAFASPPQSIPQAATGVSEESYNKPLVLPEPKPLAHYLGEFQKRQLFSAQRSGSPQSGQMARVVPGAEEIVSRLELMGIVFDEKDPVAIIRSRGSEYGNRYRVGDDVMGLRLEGIHKNSVTLTDAQQLFELKL